MKSSKASFSGTNDKMLIKDPFQEIQRREKMRQENKKVKKKSNKTFSTHMSDFLAKDQDSHNIGIRIIKGSKTVPEQVILERDDFSYKQNNQLTREEIEGYEHYIKMKRMSGEDFVRYISTPLKKKSAIELGLSEEKAQGLYLKKLSVEDLMNEKNKVKNELKYYDKVFIKKVGKPPSNREKEPLK